MMSKGKLDRVFIGYNQSPVIPKGPRSIRKRGPREKFPEDGNLCAFELLAAVAGKLLEESQSSNSSNIAERKVKPCVDRDRDEGICRNSDSRGSISERFDRASSSAESSFVLETSAEKALCTKLRICDVKNDNSSAGVVSCSDKKQRGDLSIAEAYCVKDQKQECVNNSNIILNNMESGLKFPLYRNHLKNDVQLGIRDDDDKTCFGGYDKFSTNARSEPKFIYKKIDKLRCSRLRVAAPKMRDRNLYNTSEGMKSFYRYMKKSYARERCNYHHATIKKRKLSNNKSATTDPKVRLKIKSLMVPELYINLAETDTVGSLKRAVMEEITALLGGGIRVGVVFEGRKCRGNSTTLQQAGISECIDLENLGFTLEPKLTHVDNQYTPRSPVIESAISNVSVDPTPNANIEDSNNNHLVPSPQKPPNNETPDNAVSSSDADSKALVPLITVNPEALAIIPVNPKPIKRGGISQRRTRRPFSVAEVEALVSAVEKLGTGRWRDVKMGAFESADHRTYVDLKDKWKTLVHTASISPQQRRGEPVPQELLERVLAAHSYWSKQHGKNSNDESMDGSYL